MHFGIAISTKYTFCLKWGTLNRSLPQETTFGSEA